MTVQHWALVLFPYRSVLYCCQWAFGLCLGRLSSDNKLTHHIWLSGSLLYWMDMGYSWDEPVIYSEFLSAEQFVDLVVYGSNSFTFFHVYWLFRSAFKPKYKRKADFHRALLSTTSKRLKINPWDIWSTQKGIGQGQCYHSNHELNVKFVTCFNMNTSCKPFDLIWQNFDRCLGIHPSY